MNLTRVLITAMMAFTPIGFGSLDAGSSAASTDGTSTHLHISHLDTVTLADGPIIDGYPVGGLSGINYAPGIGYIAISDNRGESGPVRLYTLSLSTDGGTIGTPHFQSQINLLDTDGNPYPPRTTDTESVRWTPEHDGFIYTSEGEAKIGRPGFIRQATPDGHYDKDIPLPSAYTPQLDANHTPVNGIRDNLGFEAMDLGADTNTLVALTENALTQDGPAANAETGSPSRLLTMDRQTGEVLGEYIYPLDRVAGGAMPIATGASELVFVDNDTYLVLERSLLTETTTFTGKIYETTTTGADNITGTTHSPADTTPMAKRLVFDFAEAGINPQCVEAMTWEPDMPDGRRTLILASDDNFGRAGTTAFHLLAVSR